MLRIAEMFVFITFGLVLWLSLSPSVGLPFILLSLAFGGMVYAEHIRPQRTYATKSFFVDWRLAARSALLGVVCSSVAISGSLVLMANASVA